MSAFSCTGPLLSFTAAGSPPSSVQVVNLDGTQVQDVRITNADGTNDTVVGWGTSDAIAKLNAAAPAYSQNCVYVLRNSSVVVRAPAGAYFTGIAVANTAIIKVQAGYSQE